MMQCKTFIESTRLECPFTWNISSKVLRLTFEMNYDPDCGSDFCPLISLMTNIMCAYAKTLRSPRTLWDINCTLEKCEANLSSLEQQAHPEISIPVARHILQATKIYVYNTFEKECEFEKVREVFVPIDLEDEKSQSTFDACVGRAWIKANVEKSINYLRGAVIRSPNCDVYHYMLGSSLRSRRKLLPVYKKSDEEERHYFERAYDIAKYPFFGIFLAQRYREEGYMTIALTIFVDVFGNVDLENENILIILKLALGLVRTRDYERAKVCFDKASRRLEEHSLDVLKLYNHYRAIYYIEKKQFRNALACLEVAIEGGNLIIEKDYLKCITSGPLARYFDAAEYLENMLQKYRGVSRSKKQFVYLELGLNYWKRRLDIERALYNFLQAYEIGPKNRTVVSGYVSCTGIFIPCNNISRYLLYGFIPRNHCYYVGDGRMMAMFNRLHYLCSIAVNMSVF